MAHSTRIVLAVFAAVGAVVLWFALTYGAVLLLGQAIDMGSISEGSRTALTTGVLGVALAGAVFAGMVCFFLVAGESEPSDPHTGSGAR